MKDKILLELVDSLHGRLPLTSFGTAELALKLLVWARLSVNQDADLVQPVGLRESLADAGYAPALLHQAFPDDPSLERLDVAKIQDALALLIRLRDQGILQAFDPVDAAAALFSEQAGLIALPAEVATLLIGLAGISTNDVVYTPWDASAQLASRSVCHAAGVYLETPRVSAAPALISLLSEKPFEVHYADPILDPSAVEAGKLRQFDITVAFPPLGLRYDLKDINRDWFERFPERTTAGTILAVRHLLAQTRRRVVLAVQNSLLFSIGSERALRQDLLEGGHIEAVVAMPAGLLATTNIAFTVLILNPAGGHQMIRFVNADAPRFRESVSKAKTRLTDPVALSEEILGARESAESVTIPSRDVLANDAQLQVDRYVLPETQKKLVALMAKTQTIALGELVTIIRPMKTVSKGNALQAREVGSADLPERGYIGEPTRSVRVANDLPPKARQQFLQRYDILLVVKGSVGKVGIVPAEIPPGGEGGWIAGGATIVLRMTDQQRLDPRVLFFLLRSPLGQELLSGIVSGATIPLIQLKQLIRLELPFPDPELAQQALDAFEKEVDLQLDIERLRKQQDALSRHLWAIT
ncbi:N-6 DNA methylase [Lamprobacter modestohalophilus]|uniref:N-6 DNA methylase n=1 Tax=Lamprobacter modestohalophilus TaxID=1064514 RepID=UPI002ADECA22|nr:N-6 DNA methylase [Lamprobacter modestohalophilus]MEA1052494.1 N-6 DNA methylase [Lamprobacter modestohalophilus]